MIKPRKNDIIKHERHKDIAIVVKSCRIYGDYVIIKGDYINLGCVESYMMNIPTKRKFKVHKLKNWQICENTEEKYIRYSKWRNLG